MLYHGSLKTHPTPEQLGPFVDRYSFDLPGLPAGDYKIVIDSTDTREQGGMETEVLIMPSLRPEPNPHLRRIVIPFTVQPAAVP
ncbi:MAG: hypothetical protein M3R04_06035 [bacterium]|nr:hypothetical protein [bacterium]